MLMLPLNSSLPILHHAISRTDEWAPFHNLICTQSCHHEQAQYMFRRAPEPIHSVPDPKYKAIKIL